MRDEEFKTVDNLKRKRPFCFGTMVLRVLTFAGNLRLSLYKLHKLHKLQEIEKGCGKLIILKMCAFIKKRNDHYIYFSKIIGGK